MKTDDQVSWQSAFWGLVPLLLSVMTQPGGRVCHFSSTIRTYVRCSPIICAADAFRTVIHMATLVRRGVNPRYAAYAVWKARVLEDDTKRESGEGLQSLEKQGFLRAVLFFLGALPQVVKIMAMRGIPWTQAWAGLYFSSFVITEAVFLLAKAPDSGNSRTENGRRPSDQSVPTVRAAPPTALYTILGVSSTFLHICLGVWTYHQLLGENPLRFAVAGPDIRGILLALYGLASGMSPVFIGCIVALLMWVFVNIIFGHSLSLDSCFFIMILFFGLSLTKLFSRSNLLEEFPVVLNLAVEFLALPSALSLVSLTMHFFSASAFFRSHVLFLPDLSSHTSTSTPKKSVERSIRACMLFVSTFVLTVLWYGLRYDPVDTLKPGWTNGLG